MKFNNGDLRLPLLDPSWQLSASCGGIGVEDFFPKLGGNTRKAQRICRGCWVQRDCREFGLTELAGTWGGFSPERRQVIRNTRRWTVDTLRWPSTPLLYPALPDGFTPQSRPLLPDPGPLVVMA